MRTVNAFAVVAVLLFAQSCANTTALIVAGESIDAAGAQFVEVGAAMNKGLDAGKVTPEQYKAWAEFAKRFKAFYRPTVDAWKAAVRANDAALAGDLGAAVTTIVLELGGFYKALVDVGIIAVKPKPVEIQ